MHIYVMIQHPLPLIYLHTPPPTSSWAYLQPWIIIFNSHRKVYGSRIYLVIPGPKQSWCNKIKHILYTIHKSACTVYKISIMYVVQNQHVRCTKSACTLYKIRMYVVQNQHVRCTKSACTLYKISMSVVQNQHVSCTKSACTMYSLQWEL